MLFPLSNDVSGFNSGGEIGPICPNNEGSIPAIKYTQIMAHILALEFDQTCMGGIISLYSRSAIYLPESFVSILNIFTSTFDEYGRDNPMAYLLLLPRSLFAFYECRCD